MSTEMPELLDMAEGEPPEPDSVLWALRNFRAVRSNILHWVLRLLPWLTLLLAIPILGASLPRFDFFLASGLLSAILSLFAFQRLMLLMPSTFTTLWNRGSLGAMATAVQSALNTIEEPLNTPDSSLNTASLEKQFRTFVHDLEGWMNHSLGQWVTGAFFAVLGLVIWFGQFREGLGGLVNLFTRPSALPPRLLGDVWRYRLGLFGEPFIGFIIGLMAWRMVVIGMQVRQLGKKFDVNLQLGHPDRCGGLEPLGNLCLWNALIATIPAIHLGAWIIIAPTLFPIQYGDRWTPLLAAMLPVPMAWAGISFFLPLLSVHQVMLAKQAVIQRRLDQLGQSINDLGRELLEQADRLEPDEGEKKVNKLELMRQIYQQNRHIPVWPFNAEILVKFFGSQAVPVLGLGKFVLDVIIGMAIDMAL